MPSICDYSKNTLKLEIQKFQKTVSILRLFKMEMRWKDWIVHVSITTVRALVYCAIVVSMQCMNIFGGLMKEIFISPEPQPFKRYMRFVYNTSIPILCQTEM